MASYSVDLRERIVKAHLEEGHNKSAVARRFGVSRWSVARYIKRILMALKSASFRAFYRWLKRDHQALFPGLPERNRSQRLLKTRQAWAAPGGGTV